jgi:hypothetical protein
VNQPAFDFETARAERDAGIAQAIDHADRIEPAFKDRAYAWIVAYAKDHRRFISEQCTDAAAATGLVSPADSRAWGHPFRKAVRDGVIRKVGFGISTRRHLSPTPLWESTR